MTLFSRKPKVQCRWMVRTDWFDVLQIGMRSSEHFWTEDDLRAALSQRNCIGLVAEHDNAIEGFVVYELHSGKLRITNFAVEPTFRRRGVGAAMVQRMKDKLAQQNRHTLTLEVRESNLDAQLFFQSQEFRAVCVLRRHYEDTREDGYVMQFGMSEPDAFAPSWTNRISNYDADHIV